MTPDPHTGQHEFYDDLWTHSWLVLHDIGPLTRTRYRLIIEMLRPHVQTKGTLLDAGCGNGRLLAHLRRAFPSLRLSAAEYSAAARRAIPPGLCERVLAGSLEDPAVLRGQCFDVITCSEVLEHLADPLAALRHMVAALAPGGLMLITVPHRQDYWNPQDEFAGHRQRFERAALIEMVRAASLQPLQTRVWGFPFSYLYLKVIAQRSPEELARHAGGRWKRLLASLLYQLFKLDDHCSSVRGFQLFLLAERSRSPAGGSLSA